jgi:hypothetical protein
LTWVSAGGGVVNNNTVTFASGAATGTKTVVARSAQTYTNAPVCYSATVTQSAAVNAIPTISRASSSGSATQTVNLGTAISAISYTASNSATNFAIIGLPENVAGNANGSTYTISGTPAASGTFGYSLTAAASGCSSTAVAGTITVNAGPPGTVSTTFCPQCCYDGSAWVDCYVTTNAYPFASTVTNTSVVWSGNGARFYSGASGSGSDKNGRVNTAAISSSTTTVNAVQICKDLGTGWYLPAYEELNAMSTSTYHLPLNDRLGALILTEGCCWSSTEFAYNYGRYSDYSTNGQSYAEGMRGDGEWCFGHKTSANLVHCAWRE